MMLSNALAHESFHKVGLSNEAITSNLVMDLLQHSEENNKKEDDRRIIKRMKRR